MFFITINLSSFYQWRAKRELYEAAYRHFSSSRQTHPSQGHETPHVVHNIHHANFDRRTC